MKNTLKINHEKGIITMDRTFAKNAENTMSAEYAHLQSVRRDYPTYAVIRRQIKKNPNKECYKGLTYEYMEDYILSHENAKQIYRDYQELRLISACHSVRYPAIKKWFLCTYPEVASFGIADNEDTSERVVKLEQMSRATKAS